MSTFQPYKGTGTPPVTVQDGNIYFDLVNKSILVDHNDARYTFSGTDTVSTTMTGASSSTAGTAGMVPAPQAGYEERYLQGDGTWDIPAARHGSNQDAVIEGNNTNASGYASHAEGMSTTALGSYSHAEGVGTLASGIDSHAEGSNTTASGSHSHAEGFLTIAEGMASHAENNQVAAIGAYAHAEGGSTTALGVYSHTEGVGTIAKYYAQHVFGTFNIIDGALTDSTTKGNYIEIAGNGTSNINRANARTLDWEGNETISGNLTSKHPTIDSSSANNNVTATTYLSTFDIRDSADRSMSKLETLVDPTGSIGGYWWVKNFDTNGNVVGKKGIVMQMDKTGAITYYVSEPDKFRDAIGVSSGGGGSSGSYLPLSGGIITGQLGLQKNPTDGTNRIYVSNEDGSVFTGLHVGSGGVNNGVYNFAPLNKWLIYCNATDVYAGAINVTTAAKALSSIGAAASNHSHTPASIGAAAASHTHPRSQITGIPNIYSKLLWDNSSPGSTYTQGQQTNFSVTDSTIANNYPIFLAMRFWTSTDSDAAMSVWFIFPKRSNNTYMDNYNETWGFTTGRFYYGRRATTDTVANYITYTATSSGGSGNFTLGQGYKNNDAAAKWCIPGQILGIYAIN